MRPGPVISILTLAECQGSAAILQVLPRHDCLGEQTSGGLLSATQGRGYSFNVLFHKVKSYLESWDPVGTGRLPPKEGLKLMP